MPKTVSTTELFRTFARLGLQRNISKSDNALNCEYWRKNPDRCYSCQVSKDIPACTRRPDGLSCKACYKRGGGCSKKVDARIYIISRRYGISNERAKHIISRATDSKNGEGSESDMVDTEVEVESDGDSVEDQYMELLSAHTGVQERLSSLEEVLADAEGRQSVLLEEKNALAVKVSALTQEVQTMESSKEELSRQSSGFQEEIKSLMGIVKEAEAKVSTVTQENQRLKNIIKNLKKKPIEPKQVNEDAAKRIESEHKMATKMRAGVVECTKFTRTVISGLASPLVVVERIEEMLGDTKAVVQGKRTLKMIEKELRQINKEASELNMVATMVLEDPEGMDWKVGP